MAERKSRAPDRSRSRTDKDPRPRGQSGNAALVVMAAVVIGMVVLHGVARQSSTTIELHRAQATADLAALAGAIGGRDAASEVARRNGVRLVEWGTDGDVVSVRVERGGVAGLAAATAGIGPVDPSAEVPRN